jgi:hypothetical protein
MQRLNGTRGTEYTKSTATVTDIKPRIMHIVLVEIVQNILSVILYQLHHSQHVYLLALNQRVTRLVPTHIALLTYPM